MANRKAKANDPRMESDSPVRESAIPRDDRPSDEEIRIRAYELYLARGDGNGNEVEDWVRAEKELRQRSLKRSRPESR